MLLGVAASLAGALIFAEAPDVVWLFVARAAMGLGVGLTAGPATAAIVEFSALAGDRARQAALFTTIAQAGGFAAALLLGGALAQYAPWPTRLTFWVLAVLLSALFAAVWFLPRQVATRTSWRPRLPHVPAAIRQPFATSAVAMMTAYTHGVLILSLGGQITYDLVGSSNQLVNGAVLAVFAIVSGIFSLAGRKLPPRLAMMLGALASSAGMGLVALAVKQHSLPVFLLAAATAGAGYSLLFLGALAIIGHAAPETHRAGVLSATYLFAYLSLGSVALGLGMVATNFGLDVAVDLGSAIIVGLSGATLILSAGLQRRV
jgi:MFS family permease